MFELLLLASVPKFAVFGLFSLAQGKAPKNLRIWVVILTWLVKKLTVFGSLSLVWRLNVYRISVVILSMVSLNLPYFGRYL